MPTPFVHLTFAMELLSHSDLAEPLYERFLPATAAFMLGNTAPDVQTLTHASRISTHFYRIRDAQQHWGWEIMLTEYPQLANPHHLDIRQAAFISGYLVHLLWDEIWTREIFTPYFMNATWWSERLDYALHHNALRVLLDRTAHTELRKHKRIINQVAEVQPYNWLPFASDYVLMQWREWLVKQLQDNGESHTVQVFASRMGVTTAKFSDVIGKLEINSCEGIPGLASALLSTHKQAIAESLDLLLRYWQMDLNLQGIQSGVVKGEDRYTRII